MSKKITQNYKKKLQDIEVETETQKWAIGYYIKRILAENGNPDAESLGDEFLLIYEKLLLIILGADGGKMLGLTIKRETSIKNNIFCLDELELEAGDWIDIGAPLKEGEAFPVTIKSLVFNKEK
jgi:ethanolamine utilization protein EutA